MSPPAAASSISTSGVEYHHAHVRSRSSGSTSQDPSFGIKACSEPNLLDFSVPSSSSSALRWDSIGSHHLPLPRSNSILGDQPSFIDESYLQRLGGSAMRLDNHYKPSDGRSRMVSSASSAKDSSQDQRLSSFANADSIAKNTLSTSTLKGKGRQSQTEETNDDDMMTKAHTSHSGPTERTAHIGNGTGARPKSMISHPGGMPRLHSGQPQSQSQFQNTTRYDQSKGARPISRTRTHNDGIWGGDGGWMVDLEKAKAGGRAWNERERVILVLGKPTTETLGPLLQSTHLTNTLILIPLSTASLPIEALASTYPNVQIFHPTPTRSSQSHQQFKSDTSHTLPALLQEATSLAQTWRRSTALSGMAGSRRTWLRMGSRRNSAATESQLQARYLASRRGSRVELGGGSVPASRRSSIDSDAVRPGISGRGSIDDGMSSSSFAPTRSRLFGRSSSKGDTRSPSSFQRPSTACPFDAILHFIPPPTAEATASSHTSHSHTSHAVYKGNNSVLNGHATPASAQKALQEMLHATVILTSSITPLLARSTTFPSFVVSASTSSSGIPGAPSSSLGGIIDTAPTSLIHIIPPNAPPPLAGIIESYVLSFMGRYGSSGGSREIQGMVVDRLSWMKSGVVGSRGEQGYDPVDLVGSYADLATDHSNRNSGFSNGKGTTNDGVMSGAEVMLFGGLRPHTRPGIGNQNSIQIQPDGRVRAYLDMWPQDRVPPSTSHAVLTRPSAKGHAQSQSLSISHQRQNLAVRHAHSHSYSSAIPGSQTRSEPGSYSQSSHRSPIAPSRPPPSRSSLSNVLLASDLGLSPDQAFTPALPQATKSSATAPVADLVSPSRQHAGNAQEVQFDEYDRNLNTDAKRQGSIAASSATTTCTSDTEPRTPDNEFESEAEQHGPRVYVAHSARNSICISITGSASASGYGRDRDLDRDLTPDYSRTGSRKEGKPDRNNYENHGVGNNQLGSGKAGIGFKSKSKSSGFRAFVKRFGRKISS